MCDEDILEAALEANVDDTPVGFGKYANKTPREILYNDPAYIVWAKENTQRFECSEELLDQAYEDQEYEKDTQSMMQSFRSLGRQSKRRIKRSMSGINRF